MPVMCSCTNALRLATALRTRINERLTLSLKKYVASKIIGKGARLMRDNFQSTPNMNNKIDKMDNRSAMIGSSLSVKISVTYLMSLIVLVVSVRICVLSYCERFRLSTFLKTETLRSFTTVCPSHAVI